MRHTFGMREQVQVGDQVFLADGGEECGAVLRITKDHLVVYVENSGEFNISGDAISAIHSQKVILDRTKLDPDLLDAIKHAHDAEEPGA